jgi:acyl-CoA dehydrogenase
LAIRRRRSGGGSALTEAEAGSDPSGLRTSARRTGGRWVLNGAKRYITNAPIADLFMVFARHDEGEQAPGDISVLARERVPHRDAVPGARPAAHRRSLRRDGASAA